MIWYAICAAVVIFIGFGIFYICQTRKGGELDEVAFGAMIGSALVATILILTQVIK